MKNHAVMHMLGCLIPLLLVMILPSFGVSSNVTYFIFIVLMFGCHILMLTGMGHNHGSESGHGTSDKGGDKHGCH
ncbi:MAG: hypothetical protein H6756_02505 [Candidatus Omnitrophica bacterium]|nr:hypothetical protein [Candidatus Omnitrophota bacterium]